MCVVTDCMTLTRARIEVNIPRKRKGSCSDHDKVYTLAIEPSWSHLMRSTNWFFFVSLQALMKFYDTLMQAVLRHVRFDGKWRERERERGRLCPAENLQGRSVY